MTAIAGTWGSLVAPVSGIYVPVPVLGDVGGPLVVDMVLQGLDSIQVQITCEITAAQAASSDPREGVFYVFAKSATATMAGLPGDYQYDILETVPDAIGTGFTARETPPKDAPYLLLMSRTANAAEVRIRAI